MCRSRAIRAAPTLAEPRRAGDPLRPADHRRASGSTVRSSSSIWRNALWSQRSNFTGIPTDCPQRDERLGWLGDANVFWDAAAFNMDVYGFTQRFCGDMRDAQTPDGAFSDYAPAARRAIDQPAPGWADAGVVLPWTAWRRYGATSIIDANWEAMARYLRYLEESNPDALWRNNRGLDFGDWLALDAKQPGDPTTPKDLIGTAWWARTTRWAPRWPRRPGARTTRRWLAGLHERIVDAFREAYVGADGGVGNGSQTGYILALKFGLVPEALRAAAATHLTDEIEGRGGVLSTGFLGTPFSLDVLADIGRADLVYDLLLRTEFPSWGYMIAKGATTIWERWNGDTGDVAMNSFNHYAFGAGGRLPVPPCRRDRRRRRRAFARSGSRRCWTRACAAPAPTMSPCSAASPPTGPGRRARLSSLR